MGDLLKLWHEVEIAGGSFLVTMSFSFTLLC